MQHSKNVVLCIVNIYMTCIRYVAALTSLNIFLCNIYIYDNFSLILRL